MNILWFNWKCWFNPEMGGAEVFTMQIAKRLVRDGHTVVLFTSGFRGSAREEYADGVRIVRAGSKRTVHGHAKKFYREESAKSRFDIIIDGVNTRPFLSPNFANQGEIIFPLIFQLAREYWFYETPFPIGLIGYFILEKRWLRPYKGLPTITISKSTEDDLLRLGFRNIVRVPVGSSVPARATLPTKMPYPVVVLDGRLGRAKRPDHALKAFVLVKRKIKDAQLWVIGDGPMKKKLQNSSEGGVLFFGKVEPSERIKLVEQAWVLVNPSVREGFGINVINAGASGTPAIGYNVPGLRDSIVNGHTGLLAKNGDINHLADVLFTVLDDHGLRTTLSQNALKYAKLFSWDESGRQFSQIIAKDHR